MLTLYKLNVDILFFCGINIYERLNFENFKVLQSQNHYKMVKNATFQDLSII